VPRTDNCAVVAGGEPSQPLTGYEVVSPLTRLPSFVIKRQPAAARDGRYLMGYCVQGETFLETETCAVDDKWAHHAMCPSPAPHRTSIASRASAIEPLREKPIPKRVQSDTRR
jgi:hypothetical protein